MIVVSKQIYGYVIFPTLSRILGADFVEHSRYSRNIPGRQKPYSPLYGEIQYPPFPLSKGETPTTVGKGVYLDRHAYTLAMTL